MKREGIVRGLRLLTVLVLLGGAPALAQYAPPYVPKSATVLLKIGAADFTGGSGRYTAIGPSYGIAFSMQPLYYLGLEIGYEGGRNGIDAYRVPQIKQAAFWRNGGTALIKIGVPVLEELHPFIGGGFGLSYVSVSGSDNGGMFAGDLTGELPFVAGFEVRSRNFTAGARVTYRVLLDTSFIQSHGLGVGAGVLDIQTTIEMRF